MTYGAGSTAAVTARLLYLRDDPAALLKAGLISSMADSPIAVSWLGAACSLAEFTGIIGVTSHVSRLVTFGQSAVTWDPESPPTCATYWTPMLQLPKGPLGSRKTPRGRSKPSQSTANHTRSKAEVRAAVVARDPAPAPRKRRPLGLPTHRTARMDAPRGTTGTCADVGTGITPATVVLSTDLPLVLIQSLH